MDLTNDEMIEKAQKAVEGAVKLHRYYQGKMQTVPKCYIRDVSELVTFIELLA